MKQELCRWFRFRFVSVSNTGPYLLQVNLIFCINWDTNITNVIANYLPLCCAVSNKKMASIFFFNTYKSLIMPYFDKILDSVFLSTSQLRFFSISKGKCSPQLTVIYNFITIQILIFDTFAKNATTLRA